MPPGWSRSRFRMSMLGSNGRLARCLQAAARLAQWDGGGAGQHHGHRRQLGVRIAHRPRREREHRRQSAGEGPSARRRGRLRPRGQSGHRRAADRGRTDLGAGPGDHPVARMDRRHAPRPADRRCWSAAARRCTGDRGRDHPEQRAAGRHQRPRHDFRSRPQSPTPSTPASGKRMRRCRSTYGGGMSLPPQHPTLPEPKIGVLLINLGTPDAPEARAVRRYLAEFLSDPRVIEIPAIRVEADPARDHPAHAPAKKSAEAYNQIWTNEGSPLARDRASAGRGAAQAPAGVSVHYAMRYGNPGIARGDRATWRARAARASSRRRSIRNIARRRRRQRMTRCSPRLRRCAGSRRCARCRLTTMIRCTSTRSRPISSASSRRSISSPSGCC